MSRMFDALRRAEAMRRRQTEAARGDAARAVSPDAEGAATGRPGSERIGVVRAPAAPGPEILAPGVDPTDLTAAMPEGLLREMGILRNAVEIALKKPKRRTLLFASASSGEGTTTIAVSYARLLAAGARERVLLVEGNVRRPSFSWRFGLGDGRGLVDCIAGECALDDVITPVGQGALAVVPGGRRDPALLQLYLERALPALLEQGLERFDTVIVDSAPVLLAPEAPVMAALTDGVVTVVAAGRTKREVVQRALDVTEAAGARNLGIALNRKKYYIPDFIYRRI